MSSGARLAGVERLEEKGMSSAGIVTELEFAVTAMTFNLETSVGVLVQTAIAWSCLRVGGYFSERITWNVGRTLMTWPFYGLAFLLGSIVVLKILKSTFGPVIPWLGDLITS